MFGGLPKRYVLAVGFLQLIAAVIAGGAMIWYWLPPTIVLVGFLLAGVGPVAFYAFTGAFMFDPTKTSDALVTEDSPSVGSRLMISLLPVAIWGLFFGFILASWGLPMVRAGAISVAGVQFPFVAERGLSDLDAQVALTSCETLSKGRADDSADVLLAQLMEADDALTECITGALRNPTTNARLFLTMRSHKWFEELMNGGVDGDQACQRASWLRRADGLGESQASMQLLMCAIDGGNAASQTCCADAIRATTQGAGIGTLLPPPRSIHNTIWLVELPVIAKFALSGGVSPEVEQSVKGEQSDLLDAWIVQAACASYERMDREPRYLLAETVSDSLNAAGQCELPPMTERTFQIWNATCEAVYGSVATPEPAMRSTYCSRLSSSLKGDTLSEARLVVRRGLRAAGAPNAKKSVMDRLMDYSVMKRSETKRRRSQTQPAHILSDQSEFLRTIDAMGMSNDEQDKLKSALELLDKTGALKPTTHGPTSGSQP